MKVVDGKGAPMGRLASYVAQMLLKGESVLVVNAEEIVISGSRENILETWLRKTGRKTWSNPHKDAPKYPRTVVGIFRRVVRGMLPRRTKRGREALRRLTVYKTAPEGVVPEKHPFKTPSKHITLKELSRLIGGTQ